MEKYFNKYSRRGLPNGANEQESFAQGFIVSKRGQWDYPGQPTMIPNANGRITMQGVYDTLLGIDDQGNSMIMKPGGEYQFPGNNVFEIPLPKAQMGVIGQQASNERKGDVYPFLSYRLGDSYPTAGVEYIKGFPTRDTRLQHSGAVGIYGSPEKIGAGARYSSKYREPNKPFNAVFDLYGGYGTDQGFYTGLGAYPMFNIVDRKDASFSAGPYFGYELQTKLPKGIVNAMQSTGDPYFADPQSLPFSERVALSSGFRYGVGAQGNIGNFYGKGKFWFDPVQGKVSDPDSDNPIIKTYQEKVGTDQVHFKPSFEISAGYNIPIDAGKSKIKKQIEEKKAREELEKEREKIRNTEVQKDGEIDFVRDIDLKKKMLNLENRRYRFQDGGEAFELELSDEEIEQYRKGGYVVEEIPKAQEGIANEQDLPGMYAYGDKKKRKKFADILDQVKAFGKTVEGRIIDKENAYPDFSLGSMKEYVQDVKDYQKQATEYEKARRLVKEGKMSTSSFADRYERNDWSRFDPNVEKINPEDQKKLEDAWYGTPDEYGRRRWMDDPRNVATVAKAVAGAAPLAPFITNPLAQLALTGYGIYDAGVNTLPAAYEDFWKGDYGSMAGNLGWAALDLMPGMVFDDVAKAGKYLGIPRWKKFDRYVRPYKWLDDEIELAKREHEAWKKEVEAEELAEKAKSSPTPKGGIPDPELFSQIGDFEFKPFSPGWESTQRMKAVAAGPQRKLSDQDFYTDTEFSKLIDQQKEYMKAQEAFEKDYPLTPGDMIVGSITGRGGGQRDELFRNLYPGVSMPDFRKKFTTPEQEALLQQYIPYQFSVRQKGKLSPRTVDITDKGGLIDHWGYDQLGRLQRGETWIQTENAKDVVNEMRGSLKNVTAKDIEKASPEQLEKWRNEIIDKAKKETTDRIRKETEKPYTAADAFRNMSLNQLVPAAGLMGLDLYNQYSQDGDVDYMQTAGMGLLGMPFFKIDRKLKNIMSDGLSKGLSPQQIAKRQLDEVGITSAQRESYKPLISDALYYGINPRGTGWGMTGAVAKAPFNLINASLKKVLGKTPTSPAGIGARDDAWGMFLGKPQKDNTFSLAETNPTPGIYSPESLEGVEKFTINKLNENPEALSGDALRYLSRPKGGKGMYPHQAEPFFKGERAIYPTDKFGDVMGQYNLRRVAPNTLEYNDLWDLSIPGLPDAVANKILGKKFLSTGQLQFDDLGKTLHTQAKGRDYRGVENLEDFVKSSKAEKSADKSFSVLKT